MSTNTQNTQNPSTLKELVIFPGEKYPVSEELLTQGDFYYNTKTKPHTLSSKRFITLFVDSQTKQLDKFYQIKGNYYKPHIDDFRNRYYSQ